MCLSKSGKYLYVANANDNSVSIIDIKQRKILETLNAALYPNSVPGSTTNSVALSADEKTLYIANADNNCLAVFDVSNPGSSQSKGFIPVGWYPTCVRVIANKIYVQMAKVSLQCLMQRLILSIRNQQSVIKQVIMINGISADYLKAH